MSTFPALATALMPTKLNAIDPTLNGLDITSSKGSLLSVQNAEISQLPIVTSRPGAFPIEECNPSSSFSTTPASPYAYTPPSAASPGESNSSVGSRTNTPRLTLKGRVAPTEDVEQDPIHARRRMGFFKSFCARKSP
jgi:hypothetical protein